MFVKKFSNCSHSAYFVPLNVDPSADLAYHAVAAHVKQQWTKLSLLSEIVAIITDNFTIIGRVQRGDIEEAIVLDSGEKTFQQFLGPIEFAMSFICCIYLRVLNNSTHDQAQAVASKIFNKRVTRNSLRLLSLPCISKLTNRVTNDYSASIATSTTKSKSKNEKKVPISSDKNLLNEARNQRKKPEFATNIERGNQWSFY